MAHLPNACGMSAIIYSLAFLCGKSLYMTDCTCTWFVCRTLDRWLKTCRIFLNFLYSFSIPAYCHRVGGFRPLFPSYNSAGQKSNARSLQAKLKVIEVCAPLWRMFSCLFPAPRCVPLSCFLAVFHLQSELWDITSFSHYMAFIIASPLFLLPFPSLYSTLQKQNSNNKK